MSKKELPKASFQVPTLNLPPKSHQTKRAMPRSVLRAYKKINKDEDEVLGIKNKKLTAYKEALLMLDQIKKTAEFVAVNGSSMLDKPMQDSVPTPNMKESEYLPAKNITGSKKESTIEGLPETQLNSQRSSKKIIYQSQKDASKLIKSEEINQDISKPSVYLCIGQALKQSFDETDVQITADGQVIFNASVSSHFYNSLPLSLRAKRIKYTRRESIREVRTLKS